MNIEEEGEGRGRVGLGEVLEEGEEGCSQREEKKKTRLWEGNASSSSSEKKTGVLFEKLQSYRCNNEEEASGGGGLNDVDVADAALCFCLGLNEDRGLVDSFGIISDVFEDRMKDVLGGLVPERPSSLDKVDLAHDCELILEKGSVDVISTGPGMYSVVGTSNFSSVRGDIDVPCEGRWMFEVQLNTPGIMQLGWVTPLTVYTSEDGVGDSRDSYAYDGKRVRKWNVESMSYGEKWTAGDVISCGIDFENGRIEYWRNGVPMGVAYTPKVLNDMSYSPGVSVSYAEACEINFGHVPFRYPVDGFLPLLPEVELASTALSCAAYLTDCLEKLTVLGQMRGAMSPGEAAAVAASHAAEMLGLEACTARMEDAYRVNSRNTLLSTIRDQAARFLMKELAWVMRSHFVVDAVFLESFQRMLFYDQRGSPMKTFLELLADNVDDRSCKDFVHAVCASCGRRVKGNVWERSMVVGRCDAVVYTRIWLHFMLNRRFVYSWLDGKDWMEEFEDFFAVRQPTNEDLAQLVPASVEDDVECMLDKMIGFGQSDSHEDMSDAVTDVVTLLKYVEDWQGQLLGTLLELKKIEEGGDEKGLVVNEVEQVLDDASVQDYLDRFAEDQATTVSRDGWLDMVKAVMVFDGHVESTMVPPYFAQFIKYITRKNLGVNREMAPPGLSNPTVVCSLHSFVVRACRKFLRKVHLEGSSFDFPPQVFLRGIRSTVVGVLDDFDDDSLDPDARLGGGLSYLCKQSIVDVCSQTCRPLHVPALEEDERAGDWLLGPMSRPMAVFEEGMLCKE